MTVAYGSTQQTWDDLVRTWCELDVPEGHRPELTAEGTFMAPAPGGAHNLIAARIHRALLPAVPDGYELFQTQTVGVREVGGIFIPDLCVARIEAIPQDSEPVLAEHVLLAVEITSRGNADHDRKKKLWAYAHGAIPQYLLIDPCNGDGPMVTLFAEPVDGEYRRTFRVPLGKSVRLGEPFGIDLDTAGF